VKDRTVAALVIAALLGGAPPAEAQAPPVAFEFPAPPGWVRTSEGQVTVFTPPAEPPGSVALWVLPALARQPDVARQVEALRAGLVKGAGLGQMRDVQEHRAVVGGVEQRWHSATYSSPTGDQRLLVLARAEGIWLGTAVFLANTAEAFVRLGPQARRTFEGFRLPGGTAASPPAPVSGSTTPGGFRGPGISGVWMAYIRPTLTVMSGRYELELRYHTFFDDGVAFADLPEGGLWSFDRAASQADPNRAGYWRTYTFSGGQGEARRPDVKFPWTLRSVKAGELKVDSDLFYRCASVDGLRLEGAWTSYANPDDPDLDRLPPGQRPILRFGRDGRFVDEGLFAVFMRSHGGGDDRPGAGRYEVRDFTMVLRYDDGRERREAFTGFLAGDPAKQDGKIFLRRTALQKRR